jgi:hypothetical protein
MRSLPVGGIPDSSSRDATARAADCTYQFLNMSAHLDSETRHVQALPGGQYSVISPLEIRTNFKALSDEEKLYISIVHGIGQAK